MNINKVLNIDVICTQPLLIIERNDCFQCSKTSLVTPLLTSRCEKRNAVCLLNEYVKQSTRRGGCESVRLCLYSSQKGCRGERGRCSTAMQFYSSAVNLVDSRGFNTLLKKKKKKTLKKMKKKTLITWHKHDTNFYTLRYAFLWARGSASCSIAGSQSLPPAPPTPPSCGWSSRWWQSMCAPSGGGSADSTAAAAANVRQERNDWIQE